MEILFLNKGSEALNPQSSLFQKSFQKSDLRSPFITTASSDQWNAQGGGPRTNGNGQYIYGGNYGGGGAWTGGSEGGSGVVRIVWPGNVRKFPYTNIGQLQS